MCEEGKESVSRPSQLEAIAQSIEQVLRAGDDRGARESDAGEAATAIATAAPSAANAPPAAEEEKKLKNKLYGDDSDKCCAREEKPYRLDRVGDVLTADRAIIVGSGAFLVHSKVFGDFSPFLRVLLDGPFAEGRSLAVRLKLPCDDLVVWHDVMQLAYSGSALEARVRNDRERFLGLVRNLEFLGAGEHGYVRDGVCSKFAEMYRPESRSFDVSWSDELPMWFIECAAERLSNKNRVYARNWVGNWLSGCPRDSSHKEFYDRARVMLEGGKIIGTTDGIIRWAEKFPDAASCFDPRVLFSVMGDIVCGTNAPQVQLQRCAACGECMNVSRAHHDLYCRRL